MQLALSTAAAPDLALPALLDACRRRGLAGLELAAGHAHGVHSGLADAALRQIRNRAAEAGVPLLGYRVENLDEAGQPGTCRMAATLGIPLIVPLGALSAPELPALAARVAAAGAALVITHPTTVRDAARAHGLVTDGASPAAGSCWEVRPGADLEHHARPVLAAAGHSLRLVRLRGGGPEAASQTGQGVGSLMAHLALARFRGPLVLAPSSPRFHQAWRAWLGRRGGWGCGSRSADATLVALNT
jgi:hypothetical protein